MLILEQTLHKFKKAKRSRNKIKQNININSPGIVRKGPTKNKQKSKRIMKNK